MNIIENFGTRISGTKRNVPITNIIIHTTGFGPFFVANFPRIGVDLTQEQFGALYAEHFGNNLEHKGHYLIGYTGLIWHIVPDHLVSTHVGAGHRAELKTRQPPKWWVDRWANFAERPTDLPAWKTGGSHGPNGASIGIDLMSSGLNLNVGYTDPQYYALRWLINHLCVKHGINKGRLWIAGHSDVDYAGKRYGSDPGIHFNWDELHIPDIQVPRLTKKDVNFGQDPTRAKNGKKSTDNLNAYTVIGNFSSEYLSDNLPFKTADYLTPEERRKGIIAQFYQLSNWHLNVVASQRGSGDAQTALNNILFPVDNPVDVEKNNAVRSDQTLGIQQRYIMALVDAEFYRRRFNARSVPAITGGWNPYPVPGFPGLVMQQPRPVLGMVNSVSHTINVAGATASTAVSMTSPRYWDEGEVWYWLGGREKYDETTDKVVHNKQYLWQNFPQWQNRYTIATNNVRLDAKGKITRVKSKLDKFYTFLLGVPSIEYRSNHADIKISEGAIKAYITKRVPGPFDINTETMALTEYNEFIAGTGKDGRFKPGTLANQFFGDIEPTSDTPERISGIQEKAIHYTERYGVNERELMVEFLGNKPVVYKNRLLYVGKTFENNIAGKSVLLNPVQQMILEYIEDLEDRSVNL